MQKPLPVCFTGSHSKNDVNQFLLFIAELYPIYSQKNQHGMSADPLVAVHKRVVADKPEAQLRRFRLQG